MRHEKYCLVNIVYKFDLLTMTLAGRVEFFFRKKCFLYNLVITLQSTTVIHSIILT